MQQKIRKKNKGVSLIEALVTIFVSAVLIIVLSQGFVIVLRLNDIQKTVSNLTTHTDRGLRRVSETIMQSKQILASAVISGITYATSSTVLALKVPSIDSSGQLINGSFDTVVYRRNPSSNDQLQEITDGQTGSSRQDGTHIAARFVTNLLFRYNNTDPTAATIVTTFLKTGATVRGTLKESAGQTTVKLRNL